MSADPEIVQVAFFNGGDMENLHTCILPGQEHSMCLACLLKDSRFADQAIEIVDAISAAYNRPTLRNSGLKVYDIIDYEDARSGFALCVELMSGNKFIFYLHNDGSTAAMFTKDTPMDGLAALELRALTQAFETTEARAIAARDSALNDEINRYRTEAQS